MSCSSISNRLIQAKDHASVQVNVGHVSEEGTYIRGEYTPFAFSGYVRKKGEADAALEFLAREKALI